MRHSVSIDTLPPLTINPIFTNRITRYFRISRIVTHMLVGVMTASAVFPWASQPLKLRLTKWWCGHLLVAFNMRVTAHGHVPPPNQAITSTMVVANHISWVDIHALNSIVPLRFIAKSEIKNWPIIGYLARKANVLFINREKRQDAARIMQVTSRSLMDGDNLCLFPEGTTTDGTTMMPFKSSIIQAAIHAKATIHPVAIRYPNPNGSANIGVAYAGETTMKESMLQILSQKNPVVELHFLAPIHTTALAHADKNRQELTLHIHDLIREKLGF